VGLGYLQTPNVGKTGCACAQPVPLAIQRWVQHPALPAPYAPRAEGGHSYQPSTLGTLQPR